MATAAQQLLYTFDLLSETEKQTVVCELLRRVRDFDFPPLSDEELVAHAEALFLDLDREEATDA